MCYWVYLSELVFLEHKGLLCPKRHLQVFSSLLCSRYWNDSGHMNHRTCSLPNNIFLRPKIQILATNLSYSSIRQSIYFNILETIKTDHGWSHRKNLKVKFKKFKISNTGSGGTGRLIHRTARYYPSSLIFPSIYWYSSTKLHI